MVKTLREEVEAFVKSLPEDGTIMGAGWVRDALQPILERHPTAQGGNGEVIPWAEYPWAKWAAKDPDEIVNLYSAQPVIEDEDGDGAQWMEGDEALEQWTESLSSQIPGPWQDSLRARPEGDGGNG